MKVQALLRIVNGTEGRDPDGNTFINVAAQCGSYPVVQALAGDYYADVNTQNNLGNTPLHYAIGYRYNHIKHYLIAQVGADESLVNKDGKTPWEGVAYKHSSAQKLDRISLH